MDIKTWNEIVGDLAPAQRAERRGVIKYGAVIMRRAALRSVMVRQAVNPMGYKPEDFGLVAGRDFPGSM